MASPTRDASSWPLVRVSLPAHITPEEYTANLDAMSVYMRRGEPFGILVDARNATPIGAAQRRELAARLRQWHDAYPGALVAIAVVASNVLQRGVVTAVNWLLRPAHALRAFEHEADAAAWLHERIAHVARASPPQAR